jgi:hypothetical protein
MKSKAAEQKTAKIIAEMAQRRLQRESQINEGPMDWVKQKAAGAYQAGKQIAKHPIQSYQTAKAGIQTARTNRANNAEAEKTSGQIGKITNAVLNAWAVQIKTLQTAGAPVTKQNFIAFMKKEAPSLNPPSDADFPADTDVVDPAKYKPFITRSIAQHFANRTNNVAAPTAAPAPKSKWSPSATDPRYGAIEAPDGRIFSKTTTGWTLKANAAAAPIAVGNIDQITALENLKSKLDGTGGAIPTESIQR